MVPLVRQIPLLEGETDEEYEKRVNREKVIDGVTGWIDTRVIAELLASHLDDTGIEVTVDNCQQVWLGTLEVLGAAGVLGQSCRRVV